MAVRPAGARALPAPLDRRLQPVTDRPDVVGAAAADPDDDGQPTGREPRPADGQRRHRAAAGAAAGGGDVGGVAGDDLDGDTPMGQAARIDSLLASTRIVMARLEHLPDGASDLQWETVTYRRLPVVGAGTELTMRVSGERRAAAARAAGAPYAWLADVRLAGRRGGAGAARCRRPGPAEQRCPRRHRPPNGLRRHHPALVGYAGFPHSMPTAQVEAMDADLLPFPPVLVLPLDETWRQGVVAGTLPRCPSS